ncbi:MAG: 3-oxoacyl-[acyl-carrier-protein] synthase 2 [Gemmatimonadota bacterium]
MITGMGLLSPHGDDPHDVFRRICAGESAIRRVHLDLEGREMDALLARPEWDPSEELAPLQILAMDPSAQMGFVAGGRALTQAGLLGADELLRDAGLYFGASFGGASLDGVFEVFYGRRSRRVKPGSVARIMPNAVTAHLSMAHGIRGPACTYSVACATSAMAIGEAFRAIRDGYLECALVGGTQATATHAWISAWNNMAVLAREHPDGPGASVRPFDAARTGFALGEGAAAFVLESEERARARGVQPLAELAGYGSSGDAFNITRPSQEGQVLCMANTLADADVPPEAVGYVNAHATATKVGDVVEIGAVKALFGAHASRLAISSTKSMHGHLIEAAGALELALTVMAVKLGHVPPTANLTDADPECDLDCVPGVGRPTPGLEWAMSNSFAFGGTNVSLLVRRV